MNSKEDGKALTEPETVTHETDPDEGLEIKPEVKQKLLQSLEKPRESFLTADEMRTKIASVDPLRQLHESIAASMEEYLPSLRLSDEQRSIFLGGQTIFPEDVKKGLDHMLQLYENLLIDVAITKWRSGLELGT